MTYTAEHSIDGPMLNNPVPRKHSSAATCRPACRDPRWPEVAAAVAALRGRACAAAARMRDPAIGITIERSEPIAALCEESGFPADIVLWHGCKGKKQADIERAEHVAARAGHALIADHPHRIGHAA